MNKRATPETDQFKVKLKTTCGEKYWVPVEHSERLERERDEAREALMEIEDRCVDCEDACDDIQKIREITVKALEAVK